MSFRINRNYLLYIFLLFSSFFGVIAHNFTSAILYFIIALFISILLLFKPIKNQISHELLFYFSLMAFALIGSFFYQQLAYSYNNIYYIQFYGSQVFFFLLFSFFIDIQSFQKKYLMLVSKYMIIISFSFVVFDYLLIAYGFESSQLMYKPQAPSYAGKPMGLFGQFSVNTTYIVIFYMLYKSTLVSTFTNSELILFLMITTTVVLERSGTGYLAYIFLFLIMFHKYAFFKYILAPLVIIVVSILVYYDVVYKFSYSYMFSLYLYFENLFMIYFNNVDDIWDLLFGIDGNFNYPIDLGPLFLIAKVGLIYFILYLLAIVYFIQKSKNPYIYLAILILMVGNMHYPTLFYPIMNVLLPIIFIYILNIEGEHSNENCIHN